MSTEIDDFFSSHPTLVIAGKDLAAFKQSTIVQSVDSGSILVPPGAECRYLPFVLRGGVKVHRTAENGREIILYHIQEGESCILSALGIVNRTPFPALAEVECDSEIMLVPAGILEILIERYQAWRRYIFAIYNDRLNAVLELVDEMLFRRIDVRLSRFLLERADESGRVLNLTHQELALELGSSREVISRVLKSLQGRDMITYGRNRIDLTNRAELENLAHM